MPQEPLVFLGIVALLTITPGADMAMVSRSVFTGGRRDAFATTLGIAAGCLVWAIASAAGVAALLAASRTAYDALRLVGAAYLVFLGLQSLWAAWRGVPPAAAANGARRASPFRQGLLTNPALFISMLLAGVHIALGIVWLSAHAWVLDRTVSAFKSSRLKRALDALTGAVLVALGVRLSAQRG